MCLVTALASLAYQGVRDARGSVSEYDNYNDELVGALTNGSHHPHPWLATMVTMIVLGLVIVIIIMFADSLNSL
jgi:hypothetical protein